jgi:predicted transcriptional regulator
MNPKDEPKDEKDDSLTPEQNNNLDEAIKQSGNGEILSLDDFSEAMKQWRKNEDDEQNTKKDKTEE